MITLPVIQTSVMSIQDLWSMLPQVNNLSNETIVSPSLTRVSVRSRYIDATSWLSHDARMGRLPALTHTSPQRYV